ncbi:hypothetical protein [Seleniivibrio woodruffii]|uniref:DUF1634 domain-containing protein n=1 Tax=Seleniivibrio woodruffii TaxID=1078050 RepID=A0A4R1K7G4_9BACT|nr:hypothetical protein [Seleniivibrio woodruffii]TCK59980.1 hypothetical protein C8D98_2152 [Seleniivibrio woodruffii]TVZ35799.1 hypothetical protein OF66_1415 [Seleniivibrio woodruffii]
MTDRVLKERIAKLYTMTTKAGIVLAVGVILLSLFGGSVFRSDTGLDYYAAMATAFMFIATPFAGVLLAFFHYLSEKNRPMVLFSLAIILVLVISVIFKLG